MFWVDFAVCFRLSLCLTVVSWGVPAILVPESMCRCFLSSVSPAFGKIGVFKNPQGVGVGQEAQSLRAPS